MRWFMHDSNAHTDAKLRKVMMRFGADGYGLYWYCLELIAGNVDAGRYTFELEHDAEILAYDLKIDSLRVEEIMRYLVSLGLFENTDGRITCLKMASRLDTRFTRSPELQQVIKQAKTGNVLRPSEACLSTVGAIEEYSIGEERRGEHSKEENMSKPSALDATDPTIQSIQPVIQVPPKTKTPPAKPVSIDHPGFAEFYAAYARHEAKADAAKAWNQTKPDLDLLLADIAERLKVGHWTGKKYVPLPATYLRGKRWEDELRQNVPDKSHQQIRTEQRRQHNIAVLFPGGSQ